MMRHVGKLASWSGDHGIVETATGRKVYVSGADMPRTFVPNIGARVSFEIVRDCGEAGALPYARSILLVVE